MITPDQITQLGEISASAKTILVFLSSKATFDQVAAATSLYLSWREQGKDVTLLAPSQPATDLALLVGTDQIQHELGNKDLQISFPYQASQVDKVSYHIDDSQEFFHLVIKPQPGVRPLPMDQVSMMYTGAEADLLITVGVNDLESLDQLYVGYEELFQTTSLISLHNYEVSFGNLKLNTAGSSCISEGMAQLLTGMGIQLSSEVATNLLAAIEDQTENFKSLGTTAETFETVARLMRFGARRMRRPGASAVASSKNLPSPTPSLSAKSDTNLFVKAMAQKNQVMGEPEAELPEETTPNKVAAVSSSSGEVAKTPAKPAKKKPKNAEEPQPGSLDYHPSQLK